jgi:hypothetical protein
VFDRPLSQVLAETDGDGKPPEAVTDELARRTVLGWTLRRYSLSRPPDIAFERTVTACKLFWLADRSNGDVILDSLRGDEYPLTERP